MDNKQHFVFLVDAFGVPQYHSRYSTKGEAKIEAGVAARFTDCRYVVMKMTATIVPPQQR